MQGNPVVTPIDPNKLYLEEIENCYKQLIL